MCILHIFQISSHEKLIATQVGRRLLLRAVYHHGQSMNFVLLLAMNLAMEFLLHHLLSTTLLQIDLIEHHLKLVEEVVRSVILPLLGRYGILIVSVKHVVSVYLFNFDILHGIGNVSGCHLFCIFSHCHQRIRMDQESTIRYFGVVRNMTQNSSLFF